MAWVITRLCRDCVDTTCVDMCPVDCIVEYAGSDRDAWPNQLFVDPEECIDCGVCETECPWEAIYADSRVPENFRDDVALNARILEDRASFRIPALKDTERPSPQDVSDNKQKWGFVEGSTGVGEIARRTVSDPGVTRG